MGAMEPRPEAGAGRVKVLHAYAGNLYGGVERLLTTLARQRGRYPEVEPHYAPCFAGRSSEELEAEGVPVHVLGAVRSRNPLSVLRARRALTALIQREKIDIVICHLAWAQAILGPAAHAGAVQVLWMHDPPGDRLHWIDRWRDGPGRTWSSAAAGSPPTGSAASIQGLPWSSLATPCRPSSLCYPRNGRRREPVSERSRGRRPSSRSAAGTDTRGTCSTSRPSAAWPIAATGSAGRSAASSGPRRSPTRKRSGRWPSAWGSPTVSGSWAGRRTWAACWRRRISIASPTPARSRSALPLSRPCTRACPWLARRSAGRPRSSQRDVECSCRRVTPRRWPMRSPR